MADVERKRIVAWVASSVMPHEAAVRGWLRRSLVPPDDIDDLIQEAYCKLSALQGFEHIERPDGYFFQIVRNLLTEQMRRARIVRFETVTEIEALPVYLDDPSPERITGARRELERVRRLIASLPERCRRVVELRKIEGLSQKEIARRLGVSESVVENEGVKGLRLILQALREEDGGSSDRVKSYDERSRNRRRD